MPQSGQPATPARAPRIVLVRTRNALNMGAAARAMANFGFSDLVLVAPYGEAWRRARSARAGAALLRQARAVATLAEALADCTYVVGTTDGSGRAPELPLEDWFTAAATLATPGAALLFGSEKTGLGNEEISYCHRLVRLPTLPNAPSMNLGQAVAVCCYELSRIPPAPAPDPAVPSEASERVLAAWYPLLERLGVVRPGHRSSQTRLLRQALRRWRLTPADERRLLGIARQLRHALDPPHRDRRNSPGQTLDP